MSVCLRQVLPHGPRAEEGEARAADDHQPPAHGEQAQERGGHGARAGRGSPLAREGLRQSLATRLVGVVVPPLWMLLEISLHDIHCLLPRAVVRQANVAAIARGWRRAQPVALVCLPGVGAGGLRRAMNSGTSAPKTPTKPFGAYRRWTSFGSNTSLRDPEISYPFRATDVTVGIDAFGEDIDPIDVPSAQLSEVLRALRTASTQLDDMLGGANPTPDKRMKYFRKISRN